MEISSSFANYPAREMFLRFVSREVSVVGNDSKYHLSRAFHNNRNDNNVEEEASKALPKYLNKIVDTVGTMG